ncbi:uncharacterized protein [Periplaneta americana]|uniref:uncharacterized protein n=1 Tax=Periplaneta americana TaxID=6978 RepID=UPI0037E873A6
MVRTQKITSRDSTQKRKGCKLSSTSSNRVEKRRIMPSSARRVTGNDTGNNRRSVNPFFNHLASLKKKLRGCDAVDIAVEGGRLWNCMSQKSKQKYYNMAREARNTTQELTTCNSSSNSRNKGQKRKTSASVPKCETLDDEGPTKRSINPFFNYLACLRKTLRGRNAVDISVEDGRRWKRMSQENKQKYYNMAREARRTTQELTNEDQKRKMSAVAVEGCRHWNRRIQRSKEKYHEMARKAGLCKCVRNDDSGI